jgi:hypothetical protein
MPFELLIDHATLATIPTQTHLNPCQARAIELLAEYNANIIYQPGKLNTLADALLWAPQFADSRITITTPQLSFLQHLVPLYEADPNLTMPYKLCQTKPNAATRFNIIDGVLRKHGLICLLAGLPRATILHEAHDAPTAGHPGGACMYHGIKKVFWWPKLKQDCLDYSKSCDICQRTKPNTHAPRHSSPATCSPALLEIHRHGFPPQPTHDYPWVHLHPRRHLPAL